MRITICGSIAFLQTMIDCQEKLEESGHKVFVPSFIPRDDSGNKITMERFYEIRKSDKMDFSWFEVEKSRAIREHFDLIAASDAILVVNCEKNGVPGYIGGNTLMEMGVAFYLEKPIFLLETIPEISYKEEIIGMRPHIIRGDLSVIAN